jgi:DNA replication protein DnaC
MRTEPLTRGRLLEDGRRRALTELHDARPSAWSDEGRAFWGQRCDECGVTRPTHEIHGLACECERPRAREIQEFHLAEHREELVEEIIQRARIPRRFADCTFDTFERVQGVDDALDVTCEWADSFTLDTERGLLLAGNFGSGKTHLGVAALRTAVERVFVEARFVSAGDLVARVRSGPNGITWHPVEDAIEAELLLLDDLGQEVGTEFTRDVVCRVIFGRYDHARPTIMTSNLGPDGLKRVFGGAVLSRIYEMADTRTLFAKDYRTRERTA